MEVRSYADAVVVISKRRFWGMLEAIPFESLSQKVFDEKLRF